MSLPITNAVWRMEKIQPSTRLVLLRLADHANAEGLAWPSVENMARTTSLSPRTVLRCLSSLAADGLLEIQPNKSPVDHRSNRYRIMLEKLSQPGATSGTASHKDALSDDTLSPQAGSSGDTASLHNGSIGDTLSLQSPSQVTNATVSSDTVSSSSDTVSKPPAPPYRKNLQEPSYEAGEETIEEAVRSIVEAEPSLASEFATRAMASALEAELKRGAKLAGLLTSLPGQWRKYTAARDRGKFEIRGRGPANFFTGGYWQDEQQWPWKPEFRPEPPRRYVDPATLYSGPEYQAVGA